MHKISPGFSLIELMIVISISMLVVGGGAITISRFNARENIKEAINNQVSALQLARNAAMTAQLPQGGFTNQLDYVMVVMNVAGSMKVVPGNITSGTGANTYYSKVVSKVDVTIEPINYGDIMFSVPEGKLLRFVAGNSGPTVPLDNTTVRQLWAKSNVAGVGDTLPVHVKADGIIQETYITTILPINTAAP